MSLAVDSILRKDPIRSGPSSCAALPPPFAPPQKKDEYRSLECHCQIRGGHKTETSRSHPIGPPHPMPCQASSWLAWGAMVPASRRCRCSFFVFVLFFFFSFLPAASQLFRFPRWLVGVEVCYVCVVNLIGGCRSLFYRVRPSARRQCSCTRDPQKIESHANREPPLLLLLPLPHWDPPGPQRAHRRCCASQGLDECLPVLAHCVRPRALLPEALTSRSDRGQPASSSF